MGCAREVGRHNGRFVESRHVAIVGAWVTDSAEFVHSHKRCPKIEGKATRTDDPNSGWKCSACIHTHTKAETVAAQRWHQAQ